jgi:hypothetical protein
MLIKLASIALAVSIVLFILFYLPERVKRGAGNRFRYIVFSILAFLLAFVILKVFL